MKRPMRFCRRSSDKPLAYAKTEDLVDIINIVIEELARRRYELPSFLVLREEAKKARAADGREFFERVSSAMRKERCRTIDRLLEADGLTKDRCG